MRRQKEGRKAFGRKEEQGPRLEVDFPEEPEKKNERVKEIEGVILYLTPQDPSSKNLSSLRMKLWHNPSTSQV